MSEPSMEQMVEDLCNAGLSIQVRKASWGWEASAQYDLSALIPDYVEDGAAARSAIHALWKQHNERRDDGD